MGMRAYILLDIVGGKSEYAVQILRSRAGVVIADPLEGRPDVIVTIEAPDRQRLAESIMPVIVCIEGITEDLRCRPSAKWDTEKATVTVHSRQMAQAPER